MEYVVTAEQMRALERYVMETAGLSDIVLMERAALATAKVLKQMTEKQRRFLVVCGVGNNGADGLALVRIMAECGYSADVVMLGDSNKYSVLRQKQEMILRTLAGETENIRIFDRLTDTNGNGNEYSVIVDAILGIGAGRMLEGELAQAVEWMNQAECQKLAMDIPTGISSDTGEKLGHAFEADVTVTYGLKKQGLLLGDGKVCAGDIVTASCGMFYPSMQKKIEELNEATVFLLKRKDVRSYLRRNPNGNKSTFGKIGIIAGSENIAGAAILATLAAFRSGSGYIRLCTHAKNKEAVLSAAPETVLDLYDNETTEEQLRQSVTDLVSFADVLCVGSGIGKSKTAEILLCELLKKSDGKTLIIDADALNLIAEHEVIYRLFHTSGANKILTPHVAEFSRLSAKTVTEIKEDRVKAAREYAKTNDCILVLKDAQTVVADRDGKACIGAGGNDGMAAAGSGDVLAGVVAGMCGQQKDPYIGACLGVYIHARSGNMAMQKLGKHSMLPTDMINCLKKCMKKLGKEAIEHETV